ncbi:hypothetical protein LZ31DRAFT_548243 [Colletotrichum somersetense]|nr:hypothetical protein LZ31DRAFT_548243 [Colletotrichum somersetense]
MISRYEGNETKAANEGTYRTDPVYCRYIAHLAVDSTTASPPGGEGKPECRTKNKIKSKNTPCLSQLTRHTRGQPATTSPNPKSPFAPLVEAPRRVNPRGWGFVALWSGCVWFCVSRIMTSVRDPLSALAERHIPHPADDDPL